VGSGSTFRSLRHRNARLFFIGLIVSNVGTWMQSTAMSILVYRLTGRATDVGITLLCQFLPMLLLGAWAGSVADRVDKRKMALCTQTAMGAQALVLGVLTLAGLTSLPVVYLLSLLLGVLAALDNPARRGLVVELVERDEIVNALALNTAVMTGSRIFGPALTAVLVDPLGPGWLFIANGLSFVAIVVPILAMDVSQLHPSPQAPRGGRPVRESLSFVRHHHSLAVLFAAFTVIGTFAFNYSVSLLKIADERFGDERLFGWLLTATSVGSVLGSLYTAGRRSVGMRFFLSAALLLGVSGILVAWSPSVWWAYVVALPLGAGGAAMIAALNGITQIESPADMRGRLLALGAVAFLGTTPIGAPVTGWVADKVSAEWSLAYGSVITLVTVVVAAAVYRRSSARALAPAPQADHDVTVAG
jgi:MFS family permease